MRTRASEISLILLDIAMPVMSGEEAFPELKRIRPDVPIVISSGYSEVEATRRFLGEGIAGFIQKPYTAAKLAAKVQAALHSNTG